MSSAGAVQTTPDMNPSQLQNAGPSVNSIKAWRTKFAQDESSHQSSGQTSPLVRPPCLPSPIANPIFVISTVAK